MSGKPTKENSLCSGKGTYRRTSWIDSDWRTEGVPKDAMLHQCRC